MSLYTFKEVCEGCKHAHWHMKCLKCYNSSDHDFCHCGIHSEDLVDLYAGECLDREENERS
jgi:hypothetical protein